MVDPDTAAVPAPRIPWTFHFVYGLKPQGEPFPLPHYLAIRSCLDVNQPDRVLVHVLNEPWGRYWDLLADEVELVPVELVPEVEAFPYDDRVPPGLQYAHHSDFVRLDALIEHGGIYADIDTMFITPYPQQLRRHPFVIGQEDPIVHQGTGRLEPSLCNAVLMAEPGAAFARRWRDEMFAAIDGTWSSHSTLLPRRLADEHPSEVHVEPARSFYRFMWRPEEFRLLFEDVTDDLAGAYSIHLWSHLWWEEERTDFSSFHAGLITEHAIRTIDTTFNRLARPHLPPFDAEFFTKPWDEPVLGNRRMGRDG